MASREISDLHPGMQWRVRALLTIAESRGLRPFVTDGWRSVEEQRELYAQGRTKPGRVVTWVRDWLSWHVVGRAIDIAFLDDDGRARWPDGRRSWPGVPADAYTRAAGIGAELGLEWGRAVWGKDMPHLMWRDGLSIGEAREDWLGIHPEHGDGS